MMARTPSHPFCVSALNSFLNSVLLLLWSCYGICIVALLRNKRRYVVQGPFQLGKAGWVINVLALFYMSFQVIFFVFPYTLPAEVHTMSDPPPPPTSSYVFFPGTG